jgi:hypothetical protein
MNLTVDFRPLPPQMRVAGFTKYMNSVIIDAVRVTEQGAECSRAQQHLDAAAAAEVCRNESISP